LETGTLDVKTGNSLANVLICAGLALVTFIIYYNVLSSDFLSIDDPVYVTANPYVTKGVTLEGISWALDFGHENGPYWMPLTMLSHMIDCQLFGLDPSKHHLTNLFFHILNAILVFLFFFKVTGDRWKSALIAALFALHPLNVESVAWITSRKNVLNTFFWLMTMLMYIRYLERKEISAYLTVLLFFLAGLMTKPAIITLIFSLLLLDMWPLHRFILFKGQDEKVTLKFFSKKNIQPLIEKLPFFALTAILLTMNFRADNFASEATGMDMVPATLRLANAVVSYIIYIFKVLLPLKLSVFYPYPTSIPFWQTAISGLILIVVSVVSIVTLKKHAWFFTGWFWFIGNLVMVSGIIQGGLWPAYADRFMYIPQLGLFVLLIWGGSALFSGISSPFKRYVPAVVVTIFIAFLAAKTYMQVQYWENGIKLYSHALSVNKNDAVSKVNLAFALDKAGKTEEAVSYYKDVIMLYPDYWQANSNLGVILVQLGREDEALLYLNEALRVNSKAAVALYNVGLLYEKKKLDDKALDFFIRAAEINSSDFDTVFKAGLIYERNKAFEKAAKYFKLALTVRPEDKTVKAHLEIVTQADDLVKIALEKIKADLENAPSDPALLSKAGKIYNLLGMQNEAIDYYKRALASDPLNAKALSGIAEIHIQKKEYDSAIELYKKLIVKKTKYTLSLYYNIACVYSLKNEKTESVKWLKKAVDGGFKYWEVIVTEEQFVNIRETDYFKQIEDIAKRNSKK